MPPFSPRSTAGLAVFAAFALAGCNAKPVEPLAATPVSRTPYVSDPDFKLPEGGGCSGDIARFRALIDNDLAAGHVNKSVHSAVVGELEAARSQCQMGDEAKAEATLAAAKKRHGYPA
jgi:hypothetical protein